MATIQKFEDLVCWKKARELANFVLVPLPRRWGEVRREVETFDLSNLSLIPSPGFGEGN